MHVGYYFPQKKLQKQRIGDMLDFLRDKHQCTLTPIDLDKPLDEQGPFDIVLHKLTDFIVQAKSAGDVYATALVSKLLAWADKHPKMVWLDPLPAVERLTDRIETSAALHECLQQFPGIFSIPTSVVVDSSSLSSTKDTAALFKDLRFPLLVKTGQACGTGGLAHTMVVAFTTEHVLAALSQRPTALVQEYIRHSNVMNKCYILNGNVRIDVRSSLDVDETGTVAIEFDSQMISKRPQDKGSAANSTRSTPTPPLPPASVDMDRVRAIAAALGKTLNLTLFGFDLIVEEGSLDYYIVDVNYFPAYDGVLDLFEQTYDLLCEKTKK